MKTFKPDFRGRLSRLKQALKEKNLEAILVTDLNNVRYLSGFTGSSAVLVIARDDAFFLTDFRYKDQASSEVNGAFRQRVYGKGWIEEASGIIKRLKPRSTGFEGSSLSYEGYKKAKKAFAKTLLKDSGSVVRKLREVKDLYEIGIMRKACRVLDAGYARAASLIKPGVVESDAAFSIEVFMRDSGADSLAFDTIIASGPRGALPHGKASSKRVRKGEFVVVDMGVRREGYNSDETRTLLIGAASRRLKKIYMTVFEAQRLAIGKVSPGVKASEVDSAARDYIKKAGFGKYFGHALGHGVGLDVHEGPVIGPESGDVLEEGMVFTIEPGIYVPGVCGVRIEDMVLVTSKGAELLTKAPKDFYGSI